MKNVIFFFSAMLMLATPVFASGDTGRNGDPESESRKLTFQDFLHQFPKGSLPYTFSENDLQHQLDIRSGNAVQTEKPERLAWEYYQFLPDLEAIAQYNNMPIYPEPVVSFETDNYYAVVYNTGRAFAKQFKTYNVALFDKNGVHLATYCIAGVQTGTLTAATLDEKLHVTIKEYEVKWEKDPTVSGIKGNSVSNLDLIQTKQVDLAAPDGSMLTPYQLPTLRPCTDVADTK